MSSSVLRRLACLCALLSFPALVFAQEAVLTGTVNDSTGGVLPGVTITATNDATGNKFVGVTDERGSYRIPARVGGYVLTAELQGVTTITRSGVPLLGGQTVNVNLQMMPSAVQETVTVTGEAPLLNVSTSNLGGNVDPTQVKELPVQQRNWLGLMQLAPGSRTTSSNPTAPLPDRHNGDTREFQLNVDGQQVSSEPGAGNQPRYSQDSIAEFQFISNRFDATLGRSTGVQVNAITKSGTNRLLGSFLGNFRDSKFNAEDPVLHQVLPYSNQQISTTLGGPIVRNKLHFFGNYEYERQPLTSIWQTPYPAFNVQLQGIRNVKMGGVRLDHQLSSKTRLMGKVSRSNLFEPFGPGTSNHP